MSNIEYYKVKSDLKDYFSAYKFSHGLGSPTSQHLEEKLQESLKHLSMSNAKRLYEEFAIQYGLILEGMMPIIEAQDIDAMQVHMPTCHACSKVLEILETARFDTSDKKKVVNYFEGLPSLASSMLEYGEYCSFNSRKCQTQEEKQQFDSIEKEISANITLKHIYKQCKDRLDGGAFPIEELIMADQEYSTMQRTISRYSEKLNRLPKKVDFMYYKEDNSALQRFINKIRNYAFIQVDKYTNPTYGVRAMSSRLRENWTLASPQN